MRRFVAGDWPPSKSKVGSHAAPEWLPRRRGCLCAYIASSFSIAALLKEPIIQQALVVLMLLILPSSGKVVALTVVARLNTLIRLEGVRDVASNS